MATYIVTKVRKEWAGTGNSLHQHIEGVCTNTGTHYTRTQVVASIDAGHTWKTQAGNYEAIIQETKFCPHPACAVTPYIKTNPDSTKKDNLENLDAC